LLRELGIKCDLADIEVRRNAADRVLDEGIIDHWSVRGGDQPLFRPTRIRDSVAVSALGKLIPWHKEMGNYGEAAIRICECLHYGRQVGGRR
jgi:hypothetical protein